MRSPESHAPCGDLTLHSRTAGQSRSVCGPLRFQELFLKGVWDTSENKNKDPAFVLEKGGGSRIWKR